jgi:hypothetical protein
MTPAFASNLRNFGGGRKLVQCSPQRLSVDGSGDQTLLLFGHLKDLSGGGIAPVYKEVMGHLGCSAVCEF